MKINEIQEPYVLTVVHARLGNVMFQLAAGMKYAKENNLNFYWAPLKADTRLDYRNYLLKSQLMETLFSSLKHVYIDEEVDVSRNDLSDVSHKSLDNVYKYGFKENAFDYRPIPSNKNVVLFGQFYNVAYFDLHESRQIFKIPKSVLQEIDELYGNLSDVTCIHVRRGDFEKGDGLLLDKDYYLNCIAKFPRGTKFIVISENIKWCKQNILKEGYEFIYSDKKSLSPAVIIDFYIMTLCKNIICSKSTFSWWGALLNSNENARVLFPTTVGDLIHKRIPNGWEKIMAIKQELIFRLNRYGK